MNEELLMAIYVQLSRVYDAIMLLLDEDKRTILDEMHSNGQLAGAAPMLIDDNDNNE